ncbi:unnamed protein product [Orchesella dallaii]|uniref:Flavin-containing monooxygenase n=1 Tax=Orchesella dallaii TaxID=48710 RepID=A0ABP1QY08_9HEXA
MLVEESLSICIIGGGLGGIGAAVRLRQQLNITNSTNIFDENKDVGGTWLVNTYPGCACDLPSHIKYGIYNNTKFQHRVSPLKWDAIVRKWNVTVLNKKTGLESKLKFDIVISAVGVLRMPNYPAQFEDFKGPKFHTAEWNSEVNQDDKIKAHNNLLFQTECQIEWVLKLVEEMILRKAGMVML